MSIRKELGELVGGFLMGGLMLAGSYLAWEIRKPSGPTNPPTNSVPQTNRRPSPSSSLSPTAEPENQPGRPGRSKPRNNLADFDDELRRNPDYVDPTRR